MDACHVLLGLRPQQYDHNTLHKGKDNTSIFQWREKKITLLPLDVTQINSNKEANATPTFLTVNGSNFQKEIKSATYTIAFLLNDTTFDNKATLTKVQNLVNEFTKLSPLELPKELPLMQDIQHNIDLVLGATLPNLPQYQMSPQEHANLIRDN